MPQAVHLARGDRYSLFHLITAQSNVFEFVFVALQEVAVRAIGKEAKISRRGLQGELGLPGRVQEVDLDPVLDRPRCGLWITSHRAFCRGSLLPARTHPTPNRNCISFCFQSASPVCSRITEVRPIRQRASTVNRIPPGRE